MDVRFPEDRHVLSDVGEWDPEVHARLSGFVAACAADPLRRKAWALFDWDHTLFLGDIGDAMFSYMLEKGLFHRPRAWRETSDHLTPAALRQLDACMQKEGARIPRSDSLRHEMVRIYFGHATSGGEPAYAGCDETACHPSYAWFARLLAGFSADEVRSLAREVLTDLLASAPNTVKYGHPHAWCARPSAPMMDLLRALQAAGLCIAVVSASPQAAVEACIAFFDLPVTRIVGVRTRTGSDGCLASELEPCGRLAGVIPYGRGKRAWISHAIGGRQDPAWENPDETLAGRMWFAAGDSNGDLAMLEDASRLRLVSFVHDNHAVRAARENADGKWLLVNVPRIGT